VPRKAREKSKSGVYHLILRGINRQTIFEDNEDRKRFLYTLNRYKKICDYNIYAYCLMENHLHLLIKIGAEPLEQIMRHIAGSYVYWYNQKYERIGNLFQDRFKSEPIETDTYLLTVSRYIHQNPLKAGVVKAPGDFTWSSYRDYLEGKGITDISFILSIFNNDKKSALAQFKTFTCANNEDECLEIKEPGRLITDEKLMEMIREKFRIKAKLINDQPREKMEKILHEMLSVDGITTRQLARVTGVSLGIIWRLKKV